MLKNKFVLSIFLVAFFKPIIAQKKGDVLYYSIENVSKFSKIKKSDKSFSVKSEEKTVGDEFSEAQETNLNNYLVPFIISEFKKNSIYQNILPLPSNKSELNSDTIYHLKIIIDVFNDNIEYQFYLKKVPKNLLVQNLKKNENSISLNETSFFINPHNLDYKNVIILEIQKFLNMYGGKNSSPIAKISIDGKIVSSNKSVFRSNIDTVVLDASASEDSETPKKFLTYVWRIKKNNEVAFLSDFNFENCIQKLVISDSGEYVFSLEVFDGVNFSKKDSVKVNIKVLEKPKIELFQKSITRINQKSVFGRKKPFIVDYIGFEVKNAEPESNLKLTYLNSFDKLGKYYLSKEKRSPDTLIIKPYPLKANRLRKNSIENYKEIAGLGIDTSKYAPIDSIKFYLTENIKSGKHFYNVYTDFAGVKSNIDTVQIVFRDKSMVNIYAGYDYFEVTKGEDYFKGFAMYIAKFGVRAYLFPRIYGDINIRMATNSYNFSGNKNITIATNALMGQLNFDLLPFSKRKMETQIVPAYLTMYISTYRIVLTDTIGLTGIPQFGAGLKAKIPLFVNKPKMGVIYLEPEIGYYTSFANSNYHTTAIGLNLIYGLWNY